MCSFCGSDFVFKNYSNDFFEFDEFEEENKSNKFLINDEDKYEKNSFQYEKIFNLVPFFSFFYVTRINLNIRLNLYGF
jgi:hypothetical protein